MITNLSRTKIIGIQIIDQSDRNTTDARILTNYGINNQLWVRVVRQRRINPSQRERMSQYKNIKQEILQKSKVSVKLQCETKQSNDNKRKTKIQQAKQLTNQNHLGHIDSNQSDKMYLTFNFF